MVVDSLYEGGDFKCVVEKMGERHVVIEFDSYEKALECHDSPEYKAASELRDTYSENDIIIIEGN